MLANPLVYMSEGLRAALSSGVPHMPAAAFLGAGGAFLALLWVASLRLFARRVVM